MIGLDTNVLVRYIVRDDPRQTLAATRLIESSCTALDPGVVSLVVLCELVWVLDRGYGYDKPALGHVVRHLLTAEELKIERGDLAWQALNLYEEGKADFADYIIGLCHREQKAEATYTLDRRTQGCDLFRQVKE